MNTTSSRLAALTNDLSVQWQYTRDSWDDAKSHEFEARYLQELNATVDRAVMVIEQLDKLLTKIKKDCE